MSIHNNPRPAYNYINASGVSVPALNGTLYFGEEFQDPVSFPIAVFSDSALTTQIPSTQVLDISGRTATPCYTAENYSLRFDDPNAVTVWEVPSVPVLDSTEDITTDVGSLTNKVINGGMTFVDTNITSPLTIVNGSWTRTPLYGFFHEGRDITAGTVARSSGNLFDSFYNMHYNNVDANATGRLLTKWQFLSEDISEWRNSFATFGAKVRHDVSATVQYRIRIFSADVTNDFSAVTEVASSAFDVVALDTSHQLSFTLDLNGSGSTRGLEMWVEANFGATTGEDFFVGDFSINEGDTLSAFEGLALSEVSSALDTLKVNNAFSELIAKGLVSTARNNLSLGDLATLDTAGTPQIDDDAVTIAKQDFMGNVIEDSVGAWGGGGGPVELPAGWSVLLIGVGQYQVTHNLNTLNYRVLCSTDVINILIGTFQYNLNDFIVHTTLRNNGALINAAASFSLRRY